MTELERRLDRAAWSVPEGWTAERLGRCPRCHDAVLWASIKVGTVLKFDRNGTDHGVTCPGRPRIGVTRSWKGQHDGKRGWETTK
jgi:hypothetical protein